MLFSQEKWKPDYFKDIPTKLAQFERHLGDNDWFAGNKVSTCRYVIESVPDTPLRPVCDKSAF